MDEYYLFSVIILLITAGAVYLATSETVFNLKRLHDLAGQSHPVTRINADGSTVVVPDTDLVPGDRFVVAQGGALPCDAVLLKGRVSIDESMLTGESVPVTKTPVDAKSIIDNDDLKKKTGHIMFSGTKILLCSEPSGEPCIAVTYRTGFRSAKGQLVGALLSAKDSFLGFFSDALWVILMMFIICTLLFVWSGVSLTDLGVDVGTCVFYYFTNITVAVPPTLTASLTVATSISIERLRKLGIFVSESTRVNWAGLVSMVCFDKTGTLTEERLHFKGFYVAKGLAESPEDTQPQIDVQAGTVEIDPADCNGFPVLCVELLATCHGLAMINDAPVGDPLEVELFRASGYVMVTTGSSAMIVQRGNSRLTIMRQFEFTADKLRAGSLILRTDGSMMYYVKGSPEAIIALSKKETVPESIGTELLSLSRRGLRIIAMGCVAFPADDHDRVMVASQAELEASVTFIGLAFLSNALKEDTIRTIETLRSASIPANMITGDHIYTAIAIAGDCGLITAKTVKIIDADPDIKSSAVQILSFETGEIEPIQLADALGAGLAAMRTATAKNPVTMQLAITGRGLEAVKQNYSALLPDLVYVVRVFARMKPADKQFIVEELLKEDEKLDVSPPTAGTTISDPEVGITNPMVRQDAGYDSSNHISRLSASVMELGDLLGNGRGQMLVMFCGDGANDMAALRYSAVNVIILNRS